MKIPTRPKRKFVPENLKIDAWEKIEPLFKNLIKRYSIEVTEFKTEIINAAN